MRTGGHRGSSKEVIPVVQARRGWRSGGQGQQGRSWVGGYKDQGAEPTTWDVVARKDGEGRSKGASSLGEGRGRRLATHRGGF